MNFENNTFRINVELHKNYKKWICFKCQLATRAWFLSVISYMIGIHYSNNIYNPATLGLKVKRNIRTKSKKKRTQVQLKYTLLSKTYCKVCP